MSREFRLQNLLQNPHLWVAGQASTGIFRPIPTGFDALDQKLGGGWPVGALTEILLSDEGAGELRCLMPAMARLTRASGLDRSSPTRWVTWVAPPHIPYAPALSQHGLDVSRLLVARAHKPLDALWAMEQALRSSACVAVIAWFADVDDRALRRIQLAAEAGQCWAVVFRPARFAQCSSPAVLRIQLKFAAGGPVLNVIRNRYGNLGAVHLSGA